MKPIFKQLGSHLQTARKETGLSQMDVAKKLGYTSPQFISNVERGLCSFPLRQIKVLMPIYNLDKEAVVGMICAAKEKEVRKALGGSSRDSK